MKDFEFGKYLLITTLGCLLIVVIFHITVFIVKTVIGEIICLYETVAKKIKR
jgi:hypothetical protein